MNTYDVNVTSLADYECSWLVKGQVCPVALTANPVASSISLVTRSDERAETFPHSETNGIGIANEPFIV